MNSLLSSHPHRPNTSEVVILTTNGRKDPLLNVVAIRWLWAALFDGAAGPTDGDPSRAFGMTPPELVILTTEGRKDPQALGTAGEEFGAALFDGAAGPTDGGPSSLALVETVC